MSLEIFNNLKYFKDMSENYNKLILEKKRLEKEIKELKDKYEKKIVAKDAFLLPNKRLEEVSWQLSRIRNKVNELVGGMKKAIEEEMKNV